MNVSTVIEDIKLLMGYPVVRLEVTDQQIEQLISRAYSIIKPYITDRKLITFPASACTDLGSKGVCEVVRLYPANPVLGVDASQEIYFDFQRYQSLGRSRANLRRVASASADDIDIPFRFSNGKLYLTQGYNYGSLTAECLVDVKLEDLEDERAITWITKYTHALVKEVLGRIRSKFKASNLPVELDGDTLLQEAQSEKERLESDLYDKEYGQFFVLR